MVSVSISNHSVFPVQSIAFYFSLQNIESLALSTEVYLSQWDHFCILSKHVSNCSPSLLQVKAAEGERDAWEGFRASLRLLHPALVLPLPPDLLSVTPDLSSLPPPPPPPAVEGEGGTTEAEPDTDSPMMWQIAMGWKLIIVKMFIIIYRRKWAILSLW